MYKYIHIKFIMKKIFILSISYSIIIMLFLFFAPEEATPLDNSVHYWQRTNPGGGGAFSTIGAGPDGLIVAASDLSGAYVSNDRGNSWTPIGASTGLTSTHVSGIGFHPSNPNILFLGTEEGIFLSTDKANSFTQVLSHGYVTDIECAPSNPSICYASYHPEYNSLQGQVYRSTNGGYSWTQASTDLPSDLRILKLIVHPQDEDKVYLLSGNGRFACGPAQVFRSTDGGAHWQNIGETLGEVLDFAIDPIHPNILYLTTMHASCDSEYYWYNLDGQFYKSSDDGIHWTALANRTGVIWIKRDNSQIIRLIDPREPYPWNSDAGTYESQDGGFTWQKIGYVEDWDYGYQGKAYYSYGSSFNGIAKTLGEDMSDPDALYWVNSQWIFGTFDGGVTFQNLYTQEVSPGWWRSRGIDNVNMMDIAISEADPDRVYLGYFDIGFWRSVDNGESWQSGNDSLYTGNWEGYGGNVASIVADPERADVVWATLAEDQNGEYPTYLLRSNAGGEKGSWLPAHSNLPLEEIMGLSLDYTSPTENRTLFVTAQGDVYRSTDDGYSWDMVLNNGGLRFTAVDRFNGNLVYAGGEDGLWRSLDGGDTWQEVGTPEMQGNPNIGFWDYGWEGISAIVPDPHRTGKVYVAVFGENRGLFVSSNSGNSWTKLLTDNYLRDVAITFQDSNFIYAASSSAFERGGYEPDSRGILFSMDGGQNWQQTNQNMAWPFAMKIAVSTTGWVFVGSPGTGFQKSRIPESNSSPVKLSLHLNLEGAYDASGDTMRTDLVRNGLLPGNQPFNTAPWNYSGSESVASFPSNTVDWVLVELRSGTESSTRVERRAALLLNNGLVTDLDGSSAVEFNTATSGYYYIVVYSYNHLPVMSAQPVFLVSDPATDYDFRTGSDQAYHTSDQAMKELESGVWGLFAGDGNGDGSINTTDRTQVWLPRNGTAYDYSSGADFNLDGAIDAIDYNRCLLPNLGTISQVPD